VFKFWPVALVVPIGLRPAWLVVLVLLPVVVPVVVPVVPCGNGVELSLFVEMVRSGL